MTTHPNPDEPNGQACPCPIGDCNLALVQIEGLHLSPVCPAHGSPLQECDWCPKCEDIREYNGEVCVSCGRVWGEES